MVFIEYIFKCSICLTYINIFIYYSISPRVNCKTSILHGIHSIYIQMQYMFNIYRYSSTYQSLRESTAKHQCNAATVCHCIHLHHMQCKVFIRFYTCSFCQLWTRLKWIARSKYQLHCTAMYSKFLIHHNWIHQIQWIHTTYIPLGNNK